MAISLKHNFTSAVADEGDTSLVRPSNWNAEHTLTLATARLIGRTTAGTGAAEEISVGTGLNLSSGSLAVSSTTPQVNSINTFTASQIIETTNNSVPALRITQLGTADALLVEDSANPDATPFAITANGHAVAGATSALTIASVVPQFQAHTTTLAEGGFGGVDWGNTATGEVSWFAKSRGGSFNTHAIVQNNDTIGDFRFYGSDGVGFIPAAMIEVDVDGTPGVNDMPGRISLFTTADGEGTVTERMRINSAGNVGIGAAVSSNAVQSLLHLMSTAGGGDVPRIRFSNGFTGHSATDGSFIGISNNSQLDFWNFENNAMRFATNNSERMRIDGAGIVGIGVTPSAWGSNWRAIETAGNSSSVLAAANVNGVGLSSNVFNDNSGWIYKTTGAAARYSVNTNTHQWFVAPSGTAGTSVTFTQAMTLDASGNLGVGTASPICRLEVASSANVNALTVGNRGANTSNALVLLSTSSIGSAMSMSAGDGIDLRIPSGVNNAVRTALSAENYAGTSPNWADVQVLLGSSNSVSARRAAIAYNGADNALSFRTGATGSHSSQTLSGTERMRITSTGDVGIGATAPDARLRVSGVENGLQARFSRVDGRGLAISTFLSAGTSDNGVLYNAGAFADAQHIWQSGGTERMRIDSAGNVGIGTASPSQRLHVSGSTVLAATSDTATALYVRGTSYGVRIGSGVGSALIEGVDNAGGTTSYQPLAVGGSIVTFPISNIERMRIDASGNVGIGTASPGRRLDVNGDAVLPNNGILNFYDAGGVARNSLQFLSGELRHGGAGAGMASQTFYTGGLERLRIADQGQFGIGGANYGTAGQVLTSGGASSAPTWSTPSASAASGMFWENDLTLTTNYTITTNKNAGTFGPVTINSGVTVTVPSGSTWTIV